MPVEIINEADPIVRPLEILKEGSVFKQSRKLQTWKKRWFVITKSHVLTYEKEKVYSKPTEVLRWKHIDNVAIDDSVKYKGKATFVLETKDGQAFSFYSEGKNDEWVNVIDIELEIQKEF